MCIQYKSCDCMDYRKSQSNHAISGAGAYKCNDATDLFTRKYIYRAVAGDWIYLNER